MPNKIKVPQAQEFTGRDMFFTPRYGTEILLPFIKKLDVVWESACGNGAMAIPLSEHHQVFTSDVRFDPEICDEKLDFLKDMLPMNRGIDDGADVIVTNPPFSLKQKFARRCMELDTPWALLIPADYSGWVIELLQQGAEKIIPTRRIDYLTPNMLKNINVAGCCNYRSLQDVPVEIIRRYTSNFHSLWLTWGLGIGKQETFVELTQEMKNRIF